MVKPPPRRPTTGSFGASQHQQWHLLLVEDDPIDAEVVARTLKNSALCVDLCRATTLMEARALLDVVKFDCILLDLHLPDGDGLDLLSQKLTSAVVVLTGMNDERNAAKALRCGAQDYLTKGEFDTQNLQRAIIHSVERAKLRAQLETVTETLKTTIAHLKIANESLARQATIDPLTGLHNRRAFEQRLDQLLKEGRRGRHFSLVLIDLDHFKAINDKHGHQDGDTLLKELGQWLLRHSREVDTAVRYGGEEFAILIVDLQQPQALTYAERLREGIAGASFIHPITASFGVSTYGPLTESAESLIATADKALYTAKEQGRNRVIPIPQEGAPLTRRSLHTVRKGHPTTDS